jgi:hypothetical protein
MLAPISANAGMFLSPARRRSGFEVFYELLVGHGIADVVVIQFDEQAMQERLRGDHGPVEDHLQVRTLAAVQAEPRPVNDLAQGLRISSDYLRRSVLPRLVEAGWIVRSDSGEWAPATPFRPVVRAIIAIEAKRRDWPRGLSQARRYRWFANQTYVVLDAAGTESLLTKRQQLDDSVGVALVDAGSHRLHMLTRPPWRSPLSRAEFALAGERAWSMALQGRRSGPVGHVFGHDRRATAMPDPRLAGAEDGRPQ